MVDLPVVVIPAASVLVLSRLNSGGIAILSGGIVLIVISPSCGMSLLCRWISILACTSIADMYLRPYINNICLSNS